MQENMSMVNVQRGQSSNVVTVEGIIAQYTIGVKVATEQQKCGE